MPPSGGSPGNTPPGMPPSGGWPMPSGGVPISADSAKAPMVSVNARMMDTMIAMIRFFICFALLAGSGCFPVDGMMIPPDP